MGRAEIFLETKMSKIKKCCFTGHRPQSLPFDIEEEGESREGLKQKIKEEIEKLINNDDIRYFISGMALGVDMLAAELIIELKKKYPDIELEAAIPCEVQYIKWSAAQKQRYFNILLKCDRKNILQKNYSPKCMLRRNRYMVDASDIVLAVWNGEAGGTGSTVKYAEKQNKRIITIDPSKYFIPVNLEIKQI